MRTSQARKHVTLSSPCFIVLGFERALERLAEIACARTSRNKLRIERS